MSKSRTSLQTAGFSAREIVGINQLSTILAGWYYASGLPITITFPCSSRDAFHLGEFAVFLSAE